MSAESVDIFRRLCDYAAHLMMDAEKVGKGTRAEIFRAAGKDMLRAAERLYQGEMDSTEALAFGARRLMQAETAIAA
ncbi:MAG: hypothetical protein ACPGOV_09605 [Magnetovibrionaceae bacterium]